MLMAHHLTNLRFRYSCLMHKARDSLKLDETRRAATTIMPPPTVTLTFNLLTRKPNRYVNRNRCDLFLVKLAPIATNILHSHGFQASPAVTLTVGLLTHYLINTSMNPRIHLWQNWVNSLHWFMRYGVHKVFGTHRHRLTHGRTDMKTECLRSLFGDGVIKEHQQSVIKITGYTVQSDNSLLWWKSARWNFVHTPGMTNR